jgi:chaperonin GroEL
MDLAVLTGGHLFSAEAGEPLEKATLSDLGQAREVQAIRSGFTLIGGRGRPAQVRQRSAELRKLIPSAPYGYERNRLIERAGKLLGGVALLEIGGATETERDFLKDRTNEAILVVRHGLQGGVVAGGGAALLACIPALDRLQLEGDEVVAAAIMKNALRAPMQAIIRNSGIEAEAIMARVAQMGNGYGYDVNREEIVDVVDAHIVDPVKVVQVAVQTGISGAVMALTTDVLVHRPRANRDDSVDFRP